MEEVRSSEALAESFTVGLHEVRILDDVHFEAILESDISWGPIRIERWVDDEETGKSGVSLHQAGQNPYVNDTVSFFLDETPQLMKILAASYIERFGYAALREALPEFLD